MTRFCPGMYQGEESLGELVGLTLADLVGIHGDHGIVAAFCLHRHPDPADRTGKLAATRPLLHRRERSAEELDRAGQHVVRREVGAVEILHSIFEVVLDPQVGDLFLTHQVPKCVLELELLNEEIVLRVESGCHLRALEIEGEPLLDPGESGPL